MWEGSSAICLNNNHQILMVLQGRDDEEWKWSVPSGKREHNETFEECCIREVLEETGYHVKVNRKVFLKDSFVSNTKVNVYYFIVNIVSGEKRIQDPDNLIHEIAWKTINELNTLKLTYPEDREILTRIIKKELNVRA